MIEPVKLFDEETLEILRQQSIQNEHKTCDDLSHLVSEERLQELFDEIVMEDKGANSIKDTSKKVVIKEYIFKEFHPYCPTCNFDLINNLGIKRCPDCNQLLAGQDPVEGQVLGYQYKGDESSGKSI